MPRHHRLAGTGGSSWLAISTAVALVAIVLTVPSFASNLRRNAIVRAVEHAKQSVVNIHGKKALRADQQQVTTSGDRQVNGMGTGIVIDERGYILTNYHVVDGVGQIKVTLANEQTLTAKLVANDPATDLAIIKITSDEPLPVITIGTSNDLMPGEDVIAVGNAYGYMHTVTSGIISALHRSVQVSEEQHYQDLIQTDASINPGNSGGPLLNIDGEMIGINVAVRVGAQGIGFALPIDQALQVAAKLIAGERKGSIGATGETRFEGQQAYFVLTKVDADSPAAKSGLKEGDVVTSVDEVQVHRWLDWERGFLNAAPGESLNVHVERESEPVSIDLVLGNESDEDQSVESLAWQILGLRFTPVDAETIAAVGETRYRGGLKVTAVRPDGPAAQRGVRRGDILVGMHKWETISLDNVLYILNNPEFRNVQPVKFFVVRGEETLYGHMRVSMGQ